MESNSLLPSQFSYRRGLGICDALITLPHHPQVALNRGMKGRELDFSAAFDRVSHCGLSYKMRSIGAGEEVLFILSEFLSDRRVRVNDKISEPVSVVSGVPQGSVLGQLFFILYTSELF